MSATFDTLRLARNLRDKAHFSTEQAEGMADALSNAMQGDLATKTGLVAVRGDLTTEIQIVRAALRETELRIDAKIEATKADLIKWMVGMIGFQTFFLLGAALALARVFTR